jgi:probable phosphoglycerate mutase
VVARVRDTPGDTLVFAHGHCLRALAARWLGEPVRLGRFLILGTATLSVLGDDRGQPAIETWNAASLDS